MRLKFVVATFVTASFSSFSNAEVCSLPQQPVIPDGRAASSAQMLKAKKEVDVYIEQIDAYLQCDSSAIKQRRAKLKVEAITLQLNEQMELYREKS